MAAQYLSYWKPSTAKDALVGDDQVLNHAGSEQYGRVQPGDTVWIVTAWRGGGLVLLGRIVVNLVTDRSTAARLLNTDNLWEATHHILAAPDRAEPAREVDLLDLAPVLRFESDRDRLDVVAGRVDAKQLQAMRRLTPESAERLRLRWEEVAEYTDALSDVQDARSAAGAGFGSLQSNREVERAAIDHVTASLRAEGWEVQSVETERIGYDLLCRRGPDQRHVEVKGVRGLVATFIITEAELRRAKSDAHFWLYVVTDAANRKPVLHQLTGREAVRRYWFMPLAHRAIPVDDKSPRSGR